MRNFEILDELERQALQINYWKQKVWNIIYHFAYNIIMWVIL